MNTELSDFVSLFNLLWYRDFPLAKGHKEAGRRAEWTTHIAICVRTAADLQGYFTHFEDGNRTDAVIRDSSQVPVANVEWEWAQPLRPAFNELDKLYRARNEARFSALITYSQDTKQDENKRILAAGWKKSKKPLLVFLVGFSFSKGRHFGNLETYLLQGGKTELLRSQPALPWEKTGSRWSTK